MLTRKKIILTGLSFFLITISFYLILESRKEFPVKVGQVWQKTISVIPFENNHALKEEEVTYNHKVIKISKDGIIYYLHGSDTLNLNLEGFLHNATLISN